MRSMVVPLVLASGAASAGHGRVACPTGAKLEGVARAAWGAKSGDVYPECYALVVDQPLWLVVGYVATGSGLHTSIGIGAALVAPDGKAWPVAAAPAHARFDSEAVEGEWLARDLDGDGRDELIQITGKQRGGESATTLTVFAVAEHTLEPGPGVRVSSTYDDSDGTTLRCTSTHRFVDGPHHTTLIEIVGPTKAVGTDCPEPGRHLYRWTGTELVER